MNSELAQKISQTIAVRTEWGVPGGYFKLLTATSVTLELHRGGKKVLDASGIAAGFYQRVDFDKVVITPSGSQDVSFLAADDEGGSDSFTGDVNISGRAHTDSTKQATGASTQCLAANAARKYLLVQVPAAAAAGVRLRTDGGVAVDDTSSIEVLPGTTWEPYVAPTGQINMIRKGGANIDFTVIEA